MKKFNINLLKKRGMIYSTVHITPKYFNNAQEEKIREKSGISNYEFFTYETLMERGQEF